MRPVFALLAVAPFVLVSSFAAPAERAHPFAPEVMRVFTPADAPAMPPLPAGVAPSPGLTPEREWLAASVRPSDRQATWHEDAFTAFIHIGPNTFTGREWGTGKESPALFAPTRLDARQWMRALKSAGIKMVVLTAKHHDGFCLWPSRFTEHSVKHSPWRDGKGDLVREVADAAKAEGLKLGIYLSPADLNATHRGIYGKTAAKPRVIPTPVPGWTPKSAFTLSGEWDEYNAYFMNQLFELLTEYGEVHQVWFDGANPKDVGQRYDYLAWYRLIRALQPKAVIQGKGPDGRWVGNERGNTRANEWNVLATDAREQFADRTDADLGSPARVAKSPALFWSIAETDVSIRHGWFWHKSEDNGQHSLDRLLDMWYGAVGGNAVFILNVPPNADGLFHDNDVKRLGELGRVLDATFAKNLAAGATVSGSPAARPGTAAAATLDGDPATGWAPADWQRTGELVYTLPAARTFNRVSLAEPVRTFGQRVERHAVDVWVDGAWKPLPLVAPVRGAWTDVGGAKTAVAEWGAIGARRIHRTETVTTDRVRVRFLDSRVSPALAEFGLYFEPARIAAPVVSRARDGRVSIAAPEGVRVRYTLDGAAPGATSPVYAGPFDLPRGGTVRARAEAATPGAGLVVGDPEALVEFGPAKAKWKVVAVSGEELADDGAAANAIDDNPDTVWHTPWKAAAPKPPHHLTVDMGETLDLRALTYLPRPAGPFVRDYAFAISLDGTTWTEVARGEFGNIRNHPVQRTVEFAPQKARFFKFTALREDQNKPFVTAAEIGVLTK